MKGRREGEREGGREGGRERGREEKKGPGNGVRDLFTLTKSQWLAWLHTMVISLKSKPFHGI